MRKKTSVWRVEKEFLCLFFAVIFPLFRRYFPHSVCYFGRHEMSVNSQCRTWWQKRNVISTGTNENKFLWLTRRVINSDRWLALLGNFHSNEFNRRRFWSSTNDDENEKNCIFRKCWNVWMNEVKWKCLRTHHCMPQIFIKFKNLFPVQLSMLMMFAMHESSRSHRTQLKLNFSSVKDDACRICGRHHFCANWACTRTQNKRMEYRFRWKNQRKRNEKKSF